jgi:hypothetical protein
MCAGDNRDQSGLRYANVTWQTAFGPDSALNGAIAPRSVPAATAGGVVFVGTPCQPAANGGCTGNVTTASSRTAPAQSARRPAECCNSSGTVGGAVWALDAASGALLNGGNPLLTPPAIAAKYRAVDFRSRLPRQRPLRRPRG